MGRSARDDAAERALVVLSGGQDSTTCLYWALDRFGPASVEAISFDYGQRHRVELKAARTIAAEAGVPHAVRQLDFFKELGQNALLDADAAIETDGRTGLPTTFVPGRNLFFLTYAAAYGYPHGVRHIVTGVAETDYSGYPDCRFDTLAALQQALSLGLDHAITLHAPLMHLDKAATVRLAKQLGALPALAHSHTCYRGEFPPCGDCPACELRAGGFAAAGVTDPLLERAAREAA